MLDGYDFNATAETDTEEKCNPAFAYANSLFAIVPCLQIIVNVIVIIAVSRNRNRLRHNFVYVYVINTLFANVLFGIFSLYNNTTDVFALERKWASDTPFRWNATEDKTKMNWWAFRNAHAATLFMLMSGSICALCYGIRESSCFVGRVARQSAMTRNSLQDRLKMAAIVVLTWTIPIALDIAVAAGWNCAQNCDCIPAQYSSDRVHPCSPGSHTDCSRILLPQKNSFVFIICILWFVEVMMIVYLNITTIQKYSRIINSKNFNSQCNAQRNSLDQVGSATRTSPNTGGNLSVIYQSDDIKVHEKTYDCVTTGNAGLDATPSDSHSSAQISSTNDVLPQESRKHFCPSSCTFKLPELNHNIKLLLALSFFFIICTAPSMVIFVIDETVDELLFTFTTAKAVILFSFLYCFISPLVLVYYMAGLRAAVNRMLFHCPVCTKTITSSSSASKIPAS